MTESVEKFIYGLFSTAGCLDQSFISSFKQSDWARVRKIGMQHRLLPMFYWQSVHAHQSLSFAPDISNAFKSAYRRSALRSLAFQHELLAISKILTVANIPYAALKGAYLAFHSYPEPSLRPLRDLDILVPSEQAVEVYELLLAAGYARLPEYSGDLQACVENNKHLPPLISCNTRVHVELHTRIADVDQQRKINLEDHGLWQRRVHRSVGGVDVSYLSPTDLLLHLIVHAAYDHVFSNGPLILSDLHYLLATEEINWQLFWYLAVKNNYKHGAVLLLAMTVHYFGKQDIEWQGNNIADETFEKFQGLAAISMLRELDHLQITNLDSHVIQQNGFFSKIWVILRKIFPPPGVIASRYPVSQKSPKVILWYLYDLFISATKKIPKYLGAKMSTNNRKESNRLASLLIWLESSDGE